MRILLCLLLGSCQAHYVGKFTSDDKNFIHELTYQDKPKRVHAFKLDSTSFIVVSWRKDTCYLYNVNSGRIEK